MSAAKGDNEVSSATCFSPKIPLEFILQATREIVTADTSYLRMTLN